MPDESTPVIKTRLFKGWRVLLLIAAALGVYTAVTFTVGGLLDSGRERRAAEQAATDARQWLAAWREYDRTATLDDAEALLQAGEWVEAETAFRAAAERMREGFRSERDEALNELEAEVFAVWRTELRDKFPFDPTADYDAPVEVVERLFNPKTGAYWRVAGRLERLASVEVNGLRAAPLPEAHARTLPAARLRDALFDGSERINVLFTVRLTGYSASLELGGQYANSGPELLMQWRGEGARLSLPKNRPVVDEPGPWGFLRLLWGLSRSEGAYKWTEGDCHIALEVSPHDAFGPETYRAFMP